MSRHFACVLTLVLCGIAASAGAAEPSTTEGISSDSLASMGLGGLTVISDEAGGEVRGMGNSAFGGSFAWGFIPPLSFSQNIYNASGTTFSQGGNASYAGWGVPVIGGVVSPFSFLGGFITGSGALAGGGSYARNN